jgi:toxin FitB
VNLVVLDTDVASASFLSRLPANIKARLAGATPCISFITLGELTKWTARRQWGPSKIAHLAAWRRHIAVLQYDERVATTWGHIQARAEMRGRPRPVNDSWIAAVCIVDDLPLITFNVKDFEDFAVHEGLQLIDGGRPVRP